MFCTAAAAGAPEMHFIIVIIIVVAGGVVVFSIFAKNGADYLPVSKLLLSLVVRRSCGDKS